MGEKYVQLPRLAALLQLGHDVWSLEDDGRDFFLRAIVGVEAVLSLLEVRTQLSHVVAALLAELARQNSSGHVEHVVVRSSVRSLQDRDNGGGVLPLEK
eukprot:CAMPEP_0182518624 /NCGR_PEP_ID=MMETSP1321-20130603/44660_1 /TAXON_ID=91990 /ORGANISM="Bolidomonas sp., Strain RCC1657" /LENGTH=98 /DNA_ID=CAMNT_0024726561 /DNA_START=312 /DNA_END=608 /DNA_ORIENTATION=+